MEQWGSIMQYTATNKYHNGRQCEEDHTNYGKFETYINPCCWWLVMVELEQWPLTSVCIMYLAHYSTSASASVGLSMQFNKAWNRMAHCYHIGFSSSALKLWVPWSAGLYQFIVCFTVCSGTSACCMPQLWHHDAGTISSQQDSVAHYGGRHYCRATITAYQGHWHVHHQKTGGSGEEHRADAECLVGRWTHPPRWIHA